VAAAVALACIAWAAEASARQEGQEQSGEEPRLSEAARDPDGASVDEVVVSGRLIGATQRLVNERINDAVVTDLLGGDTIGRLGDSTVGAALRRVPGLTLVQDKFVYIRGLGERYSASSLNGAQIPSPDLTRNVIPLDVFPTSIVESLRVQKAWSPDLPANFAGGSVDIRTRGVPDGFVASLEIGGGYNSISNTGRTYPGGGDDELGTDDGSRSLPSPIVDALAEFQGDVSVQNIFASLRRQDPSATFADAQAVNRELALALNREIGVEGKSLPFDGNVKASIGNSFEIGADWVAGFNVGGSYQNFWRKTTSVARNVNFPDRRTDTDEETTHSVNAAGTVSFGLQWLADHEISTTTLWLRNTDDETSVRDFFNENREIQDGAGFRNYHLRFEERELLTNQIRGTHYLGEDTRARLPFLSGLLGFLPTDTSISWFYSDSEATTEIPNEVEVASQTVTDRDTAEVLAEQVTLSNTAGDFRFTDLDDEVQHWGWSATLPIETRNHVLQLSGGYAHVRKARTYRQTQFSLGATSVSGTDVLQGPLDSVFSDENIMDPGNNFLFSRQGANNESYIAATMTDGVFGKVDWTINETWRFAVGARWESYRQAAVNWNPYGFSASDPQVTTDPEELAEGTFEEDEVYPSAAITWMSDLWAETFQLRFGYSETAVRPDLREITDASYIDPITGDLVRGNSGVVPAEIRNYDVRGEWFFGNGDNFTVSLFYKDIESPIEFFESPASDTTVAREILNAESAEVRGIELEGVKELGFLGGFFETLFVQGNLTLQDSELVAGPRASAPTNPVRPLSGASEYVANVMLGFDSPQAAHSASLIYNVFGERLYVAGRNGAPDGYEQPFHSLDFTYAWYPTDTLTFKLKASNLLDETLTIERGGVVAYEEDPGTSYSLSFEWAL
jgi:TonB-dependent receptor